MAKQATTNLLPFQSTFTDHRFAARNIPLSHAMCRMNYYHKIGYFQWLAKHPYFENWTLGLIVVNALWISDESDENNAETILDAMA